MKLIRHGALGRERPGLLDPNGTLRDLSGHLDDWTGAALAPDSLALIAAIDPATLPVVAPDTRLGAPVAGVRNVICVGLNYVGHAREVGVALPAEPILFNKHSATIAGPNDPILCPPDATAMDWEVELAVVIGTAAWHITLADALDHVAGYCLANDVSERFWQMERAGQWTKGKSYPGWAPLGPFLVTADAVADPGDIGLWLDVNGVRRQDGNTNDLNFGVASLVAYISTVMALLPGDVILTGTPAGVGQGFKPPIYLRAGDAICVGSSILGQQDYRVVNYDLSTVPMLLAALARA